MKTTYFYLFLTLLFLFTSCKREEKKLPKVNYDSIVKKEESSPAETTKILVADLPIQMEGTSVLIFPIGEYNVSGNSSKSKYSGGEKESFMVSNSSEYEITGYLSNLKFQQIGSDSLKVLTDKNVIIERVTYLKSFSDKSNKQFLVYEVEDMDSNKDGKTNNDDIKSLFISTISGENFTKLSADLHELIDWNLIESQNRLYFRTIEDSNKNGAFDKDDKVHYLFVDLASKELKVEHYSPI